MKKLFLNNVKGYLTEEGIFLSSNASIVGIAIEAYYETSPRKGKEMSIFINIEDNSYTSIRVIPHEIEKISYNYYRIMDNHKVIYYLRRFS